MNWSSPKMTAVFLVVAVVISIPIGVIIGYFSRRVNNYEHGSYYDTLIKNEDINFRQILTNEVNGENMKKHLKYLTSIPHMGGTPGDELSANYVYLEWKKQKLDVVEKLDYDVLLSFPDKDKFNNIEILNFEGRNETFEIKEPTYDDELDYSGIPKPFLAYAAGKSFKANEIYYANYCEEEDFIELQKRGLEVTGQLVLCRYGRIFRGNMVQFAQNFGAGGAILYDDPYRAAPKEYKHLVYPDGPFLPDTGVQRGSIFTLNGDPLTPEYPSLPYSYQEDESKAKLPSIPAQVIGYGLAKRLFDLMSNNIEIQDNSWKGELDTKYTYGGKLTNNTEIKLNVFNERRKEKTYNVQAVIKGSIEPDRYIMIGNHRDAWSFGALDPTSGTSVMLEVSRALMKLKLEKNWRPKRSIMFLSWGAEEFGLIGSTEWVEEYKKKLMANGIVYLNFDTVVKGNYSFNAASSPLLFDLLYEVTKNIQLTDNESVFDRWVKNEPSETNIELPKINPYLGSGSDYMAFIQRAGITALDQGFVRNKNDPKLSRFGITGYPTYHSSYETFNLIAKFIDPNFLAFRMSGVVAAELLRTLSDTLILPFNLVTYSNEVKREYERFERERKDFFENKLNVKLDHLKKAVESLKKTAEDFHSRLNSIDKTKYHLIRMYNEQLRLFEGAFLDGSGIERNGFQHMIYAPSISNTYGSDTFPSITDSIYNYEKNNSTENAEKIKKNLAIVTYSIYSAIHTIKEPFDFSRP